MIEAVAVLSMANLRESFISGVMSRGGITFSEAQTLADNAGYKLPTRDEILLVNVEWSPEIVEAMRVRENAPRKGEVSTSWNKSEEF